LSWLSESPTGSNYLTSGLLFGYPLYVFEDIYINGTLFFSDNPLTASDGHSKGGNIADYSEDITPVSDPSDTSAIGGSGGWLSKILQGLNKINSSIGRGFSNIVDNLKDFFNPIFGGIETQLDSIIGGFSQFQVIVSDFYNMGVTNGEFSISTLLHNFVFCSPTRLNTIWNASQTGQAINSLKGCLTSVVNCYSATPSEHVYWRFDFSNTTLFSNVGVITINFDWYNSIRTPVITLFSVFFILGFLFLWIRKIPGIISGASSNSDDK